jgi:AraC-like DNA-binding protein
MNGLTAFSTSDAPPAKRAGLFRRQMEEFFSIGLEVAPAADQPLRTDGVAYCQNRLHFAALRFSPHTTTRARRSGRPADQILVSVNKEGETFVAQNGRESWVGQDELFLIDLSRPFYIESGDILTHSVYLPSSAVRSVAPHVQNLTAQAIDGRCGAGGVFRAIVDELCRQGPGLAFEDADEIADMLPHALAPALSRVRGATALSSTDLRLLHKHRIKRFVREHLSEPQLNVKMIAESVQLSPRYVFELFSDEPQPLMKWVWAERLEGCRRELLHAGAGGRPVGQVAYSWGFTNVAHFSRSFRDRYGIPPSQLRRQAAG